MESSLVSVAVVVVQYRLIGDRLSVWIESGSAGTSHLPMRGLRSNEDELVAVRALIDAMPFARDVLRRASFGVFSDPARHPGQREIALGSWSIVRAANPHSTEPTIPAAGSGAIGGGGWYPLEELPALVDDHAVIVKAARRALSNEIVNDPVTRRLLPRHLLRTRCDDFGSSDAASRSPPLFGLLPDPFPLSAIRLFYERLLGASIDRGNFRRKLVELRPTGILQELPIFQRGVRHRAAQLFTFDQRAWERWAGSDDAAGSGTTDGGGRE
ncbi:MAG: hypothetical protein SGJ09_07780 [Phycisphaerae bacterium]|nr:hypothetical protein [Phycisphaerae bacterium]